MREHSPQRRIHFLIAALLAMPGTGTAADWVGISNSGDYDVYIDAASISRHDNSVRMWDLIDLKSPAPSPLGNTYSSSLANSEFDCTGVRVRTLYFSLHAGPMGDGDIVEIAAVSDRWLPVTSGSLLEVLWRYACATE